MPDRRAWLICDDVDDFAIADERIARHNTGQANTAQRIQSSEAG